MSKRNLYAILAVILTGVLSYQAYCGTNTKNGPIYLSSKGIQKSIEKSQNESPD